jgi:hypothetical protein
VQNEVVIRISGSKAESGMMIGMYVVWKVGTGYFNHRFGVLIAHYIREIKVLTSPKKRFIFLSIPEQFSLPLNFQHNPNLLGMAMKACHPKGLRAKPPRDIRSLPEAFCFRG